MCTRRSATNNVAAATLCGIFPPCPHADGTRNINIRIFDPHQLMNDMAPTTSAELVSDLQKFLDDLASQDHLETSTVAQLSQIKFRVRYADKKPAQTEIDGFAVNDFPIYLLTKIPPGSSSGADIRSLVCSHKIPNLVRL